MLMFKLTSLNVSHAGYGTWTNLMKGRHHIVKRRKNRTEHDFM